MRHADFCGMHANIAIGLQGTPTPFLTATRPGSSTPQTATRLISGSNLQTCGATHGAQQCNTGKL